MNQDCNQTIDYTALDMEYRAMLASDALRASLTNPKLTGVYFPAHTTCPSLAAARVTTAPSLDEIKRQIIRDARDAERAALREWRRNADPRTRPAGWIPAR